MYKIDCCYDRSYVDDFCRKNGRGSSEKTRAPTAGAKTDPTLSGRVHGSYRERLLIYHGLVRYWMPRTAPADLDRMHRVLADICDI